MKYLVVLIETDNDLRVDRVVELNDSADDKVVKIVKDVLMAETLGRIRTASEASTVQVDEITAGELETTALAVRDAADHFINVIRSHEIASTDVAAVLRAAYAMGVR